MQPAFRRYIGIDYSGAQTPTVGLSGLRVYQARGNGKPVEVLPPSPPKHWTRKGIAKLLVERLAEDIPTIVGIDHAFSFPKEYFQTHSISCKWQEFLEDFHYHWPTDGDNTRVDDVREGRVGNGAARTGDTTWRRITEKRAGGAKSVFHFDVPGSVAKSTHAGLPWLLFIRKRLGKQVHFWPFDGWKLPPGRSAIVEVYPARWNRWLPRQDRTQDQQDAFSVAAWLSDTDRNGRLGIFLKPPLTDCERPVARAEGWILGVEGKSEASKSRRFVP